MKHVTRITFLALVVCVLAFSAYAANQPVSNATGVDQYASLDQSTASAVTTIEAVIAPRLCSTTRVSFTGKATNALPLNVYTFTYERSTGISRQRPAHNPPV